MQKTSNDRFVFYTIIIAQFCGTSLWFAGNAVLPQLQQEFDWPSSYLGFLTIATQTGFILGTLCFALLGLADRLSPSRLFLTCSFIAAACNLLCVPDISSFSLVMTSRFLTGFFLAGIYPVGMKIASDWRKEGLGLWLGGLVGALVLGTSFPHLLKQFPGSSDPVSILLTVSALAIAGGILLSALVPDGPYRKRGTKFSFDGVRIAFHEPGFKKAAFGYFGHMWELYALWAFVPYIVLQYQATRDLPLSVPLISFFVIGAGALGCLTGGVVSKSRGSAQVARYMLFCSGMCCLLSFLLFRTGPWLFIPFLLFWGFTAAGDSPQFSALVANNAKPEVRGSAITMITCIGFFISILSIQVLNYFQHALEPEHLFLLLVPGPVFGLISMGKNISFRAVNFRGRGSSI